ncbi:MAG TPA: DUF4032 domain-containing protein [Roseiflexaceae bacterium]|nr:DUF4032 domain-containing protein [Roseiflexaceae bacterium]
MSSGNSWYARRSRAQFDEARRKALIAAILDMLRREPTEMLSFQEVRARLNVRGQRYLGHQTVPLDRIVGSEGRYSDFDRRFLPRSNATKSRWTRVNSAALQDVHLPPIELYKIGDIYFVRDGNHRVSVARQRGQQDIDAFVTELQVDVPLDPDLSVHDLLLMEEYSDFLEWTDLARLRPEQRIEFSETGGYLDLVRHINAHRYYMGLEQQRPIERDEAVADWYDNVYMPVVRAIRAHDVLRHFPGRTEADLYRWIMDHRWYMRERTGADPGPEEATEDYLEHFGQRRLTDAIENMLRDAMGRIKLGL